MKLHNNDLQVFERIPPGWEVTALGDVLPISYGKGLTKASRDESGGVPVYGSSGKVGVHSTALTKKPALILGRKGSVGEVYYSRMPCWPIDTVYFVEEREGLHLKFFEYLLKGLHLSRLDKSTAVPGLSRDDYSAVEVAIAPLEQQKRIVAEIEKQFSRLDEAVANLKRVKANIKRYKAAVLKAAVEGRLVETEAELARREGRSYETSEQLLKRILETRRNQSKGKGKYEKPAAPDNPDLPELPEGWLWARIGQAFDVYVGATPSRANGEHWNGGIPWVSSGEVAFCRIKTTRETISAKGLEHSSTDLHPAGTVLLGMIGEGKTRGQVAILDIEACNNQNSAAIRVSETDVLPEYIYSFLEKEYDDTRRRGSGGNQLALNKERVRQIPFALPPIAEQQRIVTKVDRRLSLLRKVEAQVDANLTRSEGLRRTILSAAFAGRVQGCSELTGHLAA